MSTSFVPPYLSQPTMIYNQVGTDTQRHSSAWEKRKRKRCEASNFELAYRDAVECNLGARAYELLATRGPLGASRREVSRM